MSTSSMIYLIFYQLSHFVSDLVNFAPCPHAADSAG